MTIFLESAEKNNMMYCTLLVLCSILVSVSSQNSFIVPEQQITSAEEVTYTIIYFDFEVYTLTLDRFGQIAEIVKQLDERLMPDTFTAHTSLLKVYEDIIEDLSRLEDVNNATLLLLDEDTISPSQTSCLFTRSVVNQKNFKDLIEGLELLMKAVPKETELTEINQRSAESSTSITFSLILFDSKGLLKDFFTSMEKQYFHLLAIKRNEIPNFISHKLNEGQCVQSTPHDQFDLIRHKTYKTGVFLTVKLTQATKVKGYISWRALPFADYILDFPNLATPLESNSSFFERKCVQIANHKRCEMLSVSTECLTCVAENNVKNVFRECNMVRNFDFDPFLTLSGIVIPRFQKIYETNLLTQERKILEIQNPNPLLSILVKTPFSLSIEMNDKTFSFGPTGNKRDILYSSISKEELANFLDFWFYFKNSPETITAILLGHVIILLSAVIALIAKTKPKKKQRFAIHSREGRTHIIKV